MWDNSVFDRAFDAVGIRQRVKRLDSGQAGGEFLARFDRPQVIVLDGMVHTTEYVIEFTTKDLVEALRYGDKLEIEVEPGIWKRFEVNQTPIAQGDGYWTRAELQEV